MYVKQTENGIEEAIREQIQIGIDNNKSPIEVASDLYWEVQNNEDLVNQYTAESMRKDWNRIASTEIASIYESSILSEHEAEAMESIKDPKKAQYFVRTGGTCEWCLSLRGSIVRLVPLSIVSDTKNESLNSIGIKDPNTDTLIFIGKNNIGLKKNDWMNACPGHPWNVATFQKIDLGEEEYNPKTDSIERKIKKDRFTPEQVDYSKKSKEEKEERKPKKISGGRIQMNNNIYEAVEPGEYNTKLEAWKKDSGKPIPVNVNSPSYRRIFEAAK